ncbi:succinate dehydrogenase iron-sulfur subunit [Dehalococcoidia bacterium]|nr:succinate dehydrogenase iron-sulfur subunit [Dehalococcoidia bacterium]
MQVKMSVRRYDPDAGTPESHFQEYDLDMPEASTVLDGLIRIREEIDGTLALRCSCRSAICGSCAVRINGHAGLACNTKATDAMPANGGPIVVEPAGNMEIVKDLVVDFAPFWSKVKAIEPWLQPDGPEPDAEYVAPNEDMLHLAGVMACVMCGACVSDCTVLEVDPNFLGPAALAKAYRFVGDPRDGADNARLGALNEYTGIWDCTRCMQCVEVCPKGVDPMGRIMALRDKAMDAGYNNKAGARHANAFADSVGHSGWLDELRLPIKTHGITNIREMLKLVPLGIRAQFAGKRPPIFHKSIVGVENVRRIFRKTEDT